MNLCDSPRRGANPHSVITVCGRRLQAPINARDAEPPAQLEEPVSLHGAPRLVPGQFCGVVVVGQGFPARNPPSTGIVWPVM
jgi:hypothetical protein